MLVIVLALVAGTALLPGCSGELPVAPDAAIDAAAPMSANSNGLIVVNFPSPEPCPVCPGPPLYVSGLGVTPGFGGVRTDGEWVALQLAREPACVPDDFNLLSGFDIPSVFSCPLTIEGRAWVRDLSDLNPVKAWENGLGAVPMYFVHLSEYEMAVTDGVLTIVELEGLSSLLTGFASFHRAVLHFPQNGRPGTHKIVSRGELEDGGSFQLTAVLVGREYVQTTITFE